MILLNIFEAKIIIFKARKLSFNAIFIKKQTTNL